MTDLGSRIKKLRTRKNFKQEDLAVLLGRPAKTISSWERGVSSPDYTTLTELCKAMDITPNELLDFPTFNITASEQSMIHKYRALDEHGADLVNYLLNSEYERVCKPSRKVRVLKLDYFPMAASAGVGNFLDDAIAEDIYVADTAEAEDADFVIPVSGDSMNPTFNDGDRVLVVKQDSINIGEIGIFIINGDSFIKELGDGCLISHNEAYDDVPLNEGDSIFCCGKVIGIAEVD